MTETPAENEKPNLRVSLKPSFSSAFVCITGQMYRLELASKRLNIIRPLVKKYKSVYVGLALENTSVHYTNYRAPTHTHYTDIRDVMHDLKTENVVPLFQKPPDDHVDINKVIFRQYDNGAKGAAYTMRRAYNHIRQYQSLFACGNILKRLGEVPDVVIRLRDDAFVADFDMESMITKVEETPRKVVAQECARWNGMNDKFAMTAGVNGMTLFQAPLKHYSSTNVPVWVINPETYYLHVYESEGMQTALTDAIKVVPSKFAKKDHCWRMWPIGIARCEIDIATSALIHTPCLGDSLIVERKKSLPFDELPIDIAIVYDCLSVRLHKFENFWNLMQTWNIRFLMIRYECEGPDIIPNTIAGYPVVTSQKIHKNWTRASNINLLHDMSDENAIFLVVDIDMEIMDNGLFQVVKNTEHDSVYFPIVWSKFAPASIGSLLKTTGLQVEPYTLHDGFWRTEGYGIFAMDSSTFSKIRMDETFVEWGGEDYDFFQRSLEQDFNVIRVRNEGIVHHWHPKDCSVFLGTSKYLDCMGAKAKSAGSQLALMTMLHEESRTRYVSPNEILDKTVFLIKTYERPDCLNNLLISIEKHAKWLPIIIADDSKHANYSKEHKHIEVLRLPFDTGTAYGRNRLVQRAKELGFEYVIMSDDDYVITDDSLIPRLAQRLIQTGADVLAPLRCEILNKDCDRGHTLTFIESEHGVRISPRIYTTTYGTECFQSDIVQQFFIAKIDAVNNIWDDHLKNNDHYDAMLSLRSRSANLIMCRDIQILHHKKMCTPQKYFRKRFDRWLDLMPYVLQKWNYSWMVDEVGRNWSVKDKSIHTQCGARCLDQPNYEQASRDEVARLEMRLNSVRPTYDHIAIVDKHVYVSRINDCEDKFTYTNMEVRWKNRNSKQARALSGHEYVMRWCKDLTRRLEYKSFSSRMPNTLIYVVPLSDLNMLKHSNVRESIINQRVDSVNVHAVYVVLGDDEKTYQFAHNEHLLRYAGPFGRAIALKVAFEWIMKHFSEAVVFSMDASMTFDNNFSKTVMSEVICGLTAFFPESKTLIGDKGLPNGFGMSALCLSDYARLDEGWNEKFWYRWGAEDMDFVDQVQRAGLLVRRARINTLRYTQHKRNGNYYGKQNALGRYLPIVPQSETRYEGESDIVAYVERKIGRKLDHGFRLNSYTLKNRKVVMLTEVSRIIHKISFALPEIDAFKQNEWRIQNEIF